MIQLDKLAEMFHSEAHERLDELARVFNSQRAELVDETGLDRARRAAHNLKGAAVTVGAQPIAGLCQILESELQLVVPPSSDQIATWLYLVGEIRGLLEHPGIVNIQLDGFSEFIGSSEGDTACAASSKPESSQSGSTDQSGADLAARVTELGGVQRRLTAQAQTLQVLFEGIAADGTASAEDRRTTEFRSCLAQLMRELQVLGDSVSQLVTRS